MNLTFSRRARVRHLTTGSVERQYRSADGRYIVVEVRGTYGRYWLAGRQLPSGQALISRHRKRAAAERACEQHRKS